MSAEPAPKLPAQFLERVARIVPAGRVDAVIDSFEAVKPTSFRVNTLLSGPTELLDALGDAAVGPASVPWCDHAFTVPPQQRDALTHSAPATYARWSTKKVAECARKQKALLRSAVEACRVGGVVLYATCSLAPEENEAVVAHTLRRLGDALALRGIDLPVENVEPGLTGWNGRTWPDDLALTRRVLPSDAMDAFFLALIEKRQATP